MRGWGTELECEEGRILLSTFKCLPYRGRCVLPHLRNCCLGFASLHSQVAVLNLVVCVPVLLKSFCMTLFFSSICQITNFVVFQLCEGCWLYNIAVSKIN